MRRKQKDLGGTSEKIIESGKTAAVDPSNCPLVFLLPPWNADLMAGTPAGILDPEAALRLEGREQMQSNNPGVWILRPSWSFHTSLELMTLAFF